MYSQFMMHGQKNNKICECDWHLYLSCFSCTGRTSHRLRTHNETEHNVYQSKPEALKAD